MRVYSTTCLSPPYFVIGNGSSITYSRSGCTILHTPTSCSFHLRNVLHVPKLMHNLLSVRKFTRGNLCSNEFDPFNFSMKDLRRKAVIYRCNNDGDLYTFPSSAAAAFIAPVVSPEVWHRHLGHPSRDNTTSLR